MCHCSELAYCSGLNVDRLRHHKLSPLTFEHLYGVVMGSVNRGIWSKRTPMFYVVQSRPVSMYLAVCNSRTTTRHPSWYVVCPSASPITGPSRGMRLLCALIFDGGSIQLVYLFNHIIYTKYRQHEPVIRSFNSSSALSVACARYCITPFPCHSATLAIHPPNKLPGRDILSSLRNK